MEDEETPSGEYVVLNFPDDDVRIDFFFAPGNFVRVVRGDQSMLYQATVVEEGSSVADTMQRWYHAAAEKAGLKPTESAAG